MRTTHRRAILVGLTISAVITACNGLGGSESSRPSEESPLADLWWARPGTTTCGVPALYRLNGGIWQLGSCAGTLVDPPASTDLVIGEEVDLHMTTITDSTGSTDPLYDLPSSSNTSVLKLVLATDGGATGVYRAENTGSAFLTTSGRCATVGGDTAVRNCPVLEVRVISR